MKTKIALSILAATLVFSGCNSSDTEGTNEGYFIDSAVSGVEYETTSGVSGTTDSLGRFTYNDGDEVTFKLGKVVLGTTTPQTDGLVTPKTLVAGDGVPTTEQENTITLMLQTLQSLDVDGDPTNGITIPEAVTTELENLTSTLDFKSLDEKKLIELDNQLNLGLDQDYDGKLDVDATQAKTHFESSIEKFQQGVEATTSTLNQKGNGKMNGKNVQTSDLNQTTEMSSSTMTFDIKNYPKSTLTQLLKDSLAYMGNEERLAYDVYMNLYNYHKTNNNIEIRQLTNIAQKAEVKHIGIVQSLVQRYNLSATDLTDVNQSASVDGNAVTLENMPSGKYDIKAIQTLYNKLYNKGIQSTKDALMVGCMVEVTDINDLNKYVTLAQESNATDVLEAFKVLRDGSYNHYWAFDKGLKNLGIENGCYVEGDELLGDKSSVYPQHTH